MSAAVTHLTDTFTAAEQDGYEVTRVGRNVLHDILGSNELAVAKRPSRLRSGTLSLVFTSYATAASLMTALSSGDLLGFSNTDEPGVAMTFVVDGDAAMEIDETRSRWLVSFTFQEVS